MDKKFITGIVVVTLVMLIVGVVFLSKFSPSGNYRNPHGGTLGADVQSSSDADTKPKPPDFTLPKYDGSGEVNLISYYNAKPTVVQFWATWCEFCRREFPVTNAMVANYKGQVNYLAVNFSQESRDAVRNYIKELELDPTILTFVMDETGTVGRAYGVRGTPVHLFIKKGGEVSLFRVGYMSPQLMKDEIAKIL